MCTQSLEDILVDHVTESPVHLRLRRRPSTHCIDDIAIYKVCGCCAYEVVDPVDRWIERGCLVEDVKCISYPVSWAVPVLLTHRQGHRYLLRDEVQVKRR